MLINIYLFNHIIGLLFEEFLLVFIYVAFWRWTLDKTAVSSSGAPVCNIIEIVGPRAGPTRQFVHCNQAI